MVHRKNNLILEKSQNYSMGARKKHQLNKKVQNVCLETKKLTTNHNEKNIIKKLN